MKKQILNIGKTLSKAEQKQISGGRREPGEEENCSGPSSHQPCSGGLTWNSCAVAGEICYSPPEGGPSFCYCETGSD